MKAIQAIKKMVALGMGITMVGATIFGASAVQLSDWPAPFVVNGTPASNLAVVVGDAADAIDVVGMGDIVGGLQAAAVVKTTMAAGGSGKGVVVEGDAVEIGSTSDLLELGEALGLVRETITEVDLDMLKGGQIVTDAGSTEYNQYLRFNVTNQSTVPPSGAVIFNRDERDRVGHYLHWRDGFRLFEWELEFEEGLKSKTEGDNMKDLNDEDIIILGQPFVVVDTTLRNSSSACTVQSCGDLTIDFMGGAISAILGENDKETYVVDGKEYEVEVLVISETSNLGEGSVKFRINGEITDELSDGDTDVLADGTQVGIRDILATGKDIQKSIVQFYIGAYKVSMRDTNTADQVAIQGGTSVNEETIEDAWTQIIGQFSQGGFASAGTAAGLQVGQPFEGSVYVLSDIKYKLDSDCVLGDAYIPPGSGLREQLDEPEGMLTPFWDIRYEGLMDTGVTIVRVDAAGNDKYDLEFTNQEGIFYDMPLATNEGSATNFKFGKDTDDLWMVESAQAGDDVLNGGAQITRHDYFVLSNCRDYSAVAGNGMKNTCFSHVLRWDSVDTTNNQVSFTDLGTGTREVTLLPDAAQTWSNGNLIVGGVTYAIRLNMTTNASIAVDQNGNGVFENANRSLLIGIQGEGQISLKNGTGCMINPNATICATHSYVATVNGSGPAGAPILSGISGGNITMNLTTRAKEFDDAPGAGVDESILWNVNPAAGNEIRLPSATVTAYPLFYQPGMFSLEENEDLEQAMSYYGVFLELFDPASTDKAQSLTIEYPLSERGARVFVTGGLVSTSTVEGGVTEKVQALPVGVSKLASEVADITQYNAIVVGGPCANPISAQLMGNPEPCWESIAKGVAKIYEHANGNVALLAAGRTGQDTRRVARAIATGQIASVNSKEAEISGTTMTDITVKAV